MDDSDSIKFSTIKIFEKKTFVGKKSNLANKKMCINAKSYFFL